MSARFLAALALTTSLPAMCPATEIIAHRGYSARAPENTAAAFRLAWAHGTDACELDLYLASDGGVVVIHDGSTLRTTGVDKPVAQSSAADLLALDAGAWKGAQWAGEKIPSLEQALATLPPDRGRFFLEIKCGPEVIPALTAILEPMKDRASQLAIISFNRAAVAEAKKAMPWIKVFRLASGVEKKTKQPNDLDKVLAETREDGLDGVDLGSDWPWSADFVRKIKDAGMEAYIWTVNDPAQARRLAEIGVDGITTDDPIVIRKAIEGVNATPAP